MVELSNAEKIIARLLVDLAIRKTSIPYSDLSNILDRKYDIKINEHFGLSVPLGNIAILCSELGLPLLSVRIEYKNDPGKTAEGFYKIACELKPEYKSMTPKEVRNTELERTRACTEWQRLLNYLDEKDSVLLQGGSLTISEQIAIYVEEIINQDGIGHIVSTQEIENELIQRYGTNRSSIMPYDYCYNRWNEGVPSGRPLYFEYLEKTQYRVLGENYPYNGDIFAHPKGDIERPVGYCINGKQYLGKSPIYPDEYPDDSPEYREGKKKMVNVNIYERNPAARQSCINHYGAVCYICKFDFGKQYGADCEGMIHVHHLKMISEADKEYAVDPINDLRPVCPNCHMVLHSKREGYTIEEVKSML